jgi:hypothetical protein
MNKIKAITSLIGETSVFEYYIVPKKLDWLLCENHDKLIGIEEPVIARIKTTIKDHI